MAIPDIFSKLVGRARGAFAAAALPQRELGKTGVSVTLFGLGGEGVLRTSGRMREAVPVIRKALEVGVQYFDTAPAYSQSQDYYGEALGPDRKKIFLASKTHDRTRDGSLKLLQDSLRRLKTDHLDLWQLHDLRDDSDIEAIFSKRGAIHALEEARSQGLVRFLGITGHTDPRILAEAVRRYPFDTALVALNAADRHHLSFIEQFLPAAQERNMGIIGMKIYNRGAIFQKGGVESAEDAFRYVLTLPVSLAIIGCRSPEEVERNAQFARAFKPLGSEAMARLEKLTRPYAEQASDFKDWSRD